jgi:mono/diheme cytochrome c family protein
MLISSIWRIDDPPAMTSSARGLDDLPTSMEYAMAKLTKSGLMVLGWTLIVGASMTDGALAADAARGKGKFEAACAECHAAADLKGAAAATFGEKLQQIAAGKGKHRPKLKLSAEEVADLGGYLATLK